MSHHVPIRFIAGSREIAAVQRHVELVSAALEHLLAGADIALPPLTGEAEGYRITCAPAEFAEHCKAAYPDLLLGAYQAFNRNYIDMRGTFEEYMAQFSSKTRSTLRRKTRKIEEISGGALDLREYKSGAEIREFLAHAIPLSQQTYQARLLDAGLPESEEAQDAMIARADAGEVRAYLLFIDGKAAAYLYLPIENTTLVYAYLGYAPDAAHLSVGTVLQLAALERLYAENRFQYFDFTEGDGAHKEMFGTGQIACCRFVLLKNTLSNRVLLGSLDAFDTSIAVVKSLAEKTGALAHARKLLRA